MTSERSHNLLAILSLRWAGNVAFIHSLVFSLEGRAWQEPELSHVTSMALAQYILGKFSWG